MRTGNTTNSHSFRDAHKTEGGSAMDELADEVVLRILGSLDPEHKVPVVGPTSLVLLISAVRGGASVHGVGAFAAQVMLLSSRREACAKIRRQQRLGASSVAALVCRLWRAYRR